MTVWGTDEEVKAALRALVTADPPILIGWQHYPGAGDREWLVNPAAGPCEHKDAAGIRSYVATARYVDRDLSRWAA